MSATSGEASQGLLASLKTLLTTLVEVVHTRLSLLSLDFEAEQAHFFSLLKATLLTFFFAGVGVVLAAIFLVVAFWDTYRLETLGGLSLFFLLMAILTWVDKAIRINNKSRLFGTTLDELVKDQDKLGPRL